MFKSTKLALIRLSVDNSVLNVNRNNNQFLYASAVIEETSGPGSPDGDGSLIAETLSSNTSSNSNSNTNTNRERAKPPATTEPRISRISRISPDSNITSVFNYNNRGIPLLFSTITPGAYELTKVAEIIKEENDGNVIIEQDINTMKCKMKIKQGALSLDVDNSIASLLGFRKIVYKPGKYKYQKIIDIKGFSTINIHCNFISGVKHKCNNTNIQYTFTLTEPAGYLINIMPTNILYQNITKDRIDYIDINIKDEHGRPIGFNGDVLSFTLHLI